MSSTLSGSAMTATVAETRRIRQAPHGERVTVTKALAHELSQIGPKVTEEVAHKRLYGEGNIRLQAECVARAYRAADADAALQQFLHDIQAAGRGPAPKFTRELILSYGQVDRKDDGTREALIAMRTRETFRAWRADFFRAMALGLGLVEAGEAEWGE